MPRTKTWKQKWHAFAAKPPGRRFRERHEQRRGSRRERGWWRPALNLGAGVVLLGVGVFLLVVPGPGIPFLVAGGVLLATESYWAARIADGIDVLLAPAIRWCARRWRALSRGVRRTLTGCMIAGSVLTIVFMVVRR
jgi:hypothetical protein